MEIAKKHLDTCLLGCWLSVKVGMNIANEASGYCSAHLLAIGMNENLRQSI
jgi:hypothetical protein